jgi:putative flavoprotein involved in K+ transport
MTADRAGSDPLDVLIIGAGQAGLALGWHLRRQGVDFTLVDAAARIGDSWRARWDSLRLFTPAEYDALPGMPFPAPPGTYPGRDQVAAYLEHYAETFDLPVHLGTRVTRLTRDHEAFAAETPTGEIQARNVVVATGPFQVPFVPRWSAGLGPEVAQRHSAAYRRPADVPGGSVLVVGAGNSGFQIAEELARAGRRVTVAIGSRPVVVPQRLLGRDLFWWSGRARLIQRPADSRLGRRLRRSPETVIGTTWRAVRVLGITLRPRALQADQNAVTFTDGSSLDVDAVVWATGYRPDYAWLDVPGAVADGQVVHERGISPVPGLHFLGLPWQYTRGSALLGFVKDDAAWLAERLAAESAADGSAARARAGQRRRGQAAGCGRRCARPARGTSAAAAPPWPTCGPVSEVSESVPG